MKYLGCNSICGMWNSISVQILGDLHSLVFQNEAGAGRCLTVLNESCKLKLCAGVGRLTVLGRSEYNQWEYYQRPYIRETMHSALNL